MSDGTFDIPVHKKTTLDNGLRVVSTTMPHTNAVSIVLLFGAGSRFENDELAGSSHLFEHLLFKGTRRRPTPREISEIVEGVGGALNAFTDREMTGYWCRIPRSSWQDGLDVLIDMAREPLFRDEDIAKEKQVVFEEIRASNDSPEARVEIMLDELLWPNQPLGRDIAGSIESVTAVSRGAMLGYMASQYVPSNLIIAVAGGVTHEELLNRVTTLCGDWENRSPLGFPGVERNFRGPKVQVEHRPTEQAHLAFGLHGLSASAPERHALRLLSVTLGETMSSRLFEEVREKRGLAYAIHSGVIAFSDTGSFNVSSGVDPKRAHEAVEVIVGELAKARDGVTKTELEKAKTLSKGRLLLRLEESRSVAMSIGAQELVRGQIETPQAMLKAIDAVTAEDTAAIAQRVIDSGQLALALVGPFEDEAGFAPLLRF